MSLGRENWKQIDGRGTRKTLEMGKWIWKKWKMGKMGRIHWPELDSIFPYPFVLPSGSLSGPLSMPFSNLQNCVAPTNPFLASPGSHQAPFGLSRHPQGAPFVFENPEEFLRVPTNLFLESQSLWESPGSHSQSLFWNDCRNP